MEHDVHLSEDVERGGLTSKIIAAVVVGAAILALAGYIVFGSGMWA
jgi:hypothetical protein